MPWQTKAPAGKEGTSSRQRGLSRCILQPPETLTQWVSLGLYHRSPQLMQENDPFSGQDSSSSYDPQRVWFASRDTSPPYAQSHVRMSYPTWFIQAVSKFLYEDESRTFNSVQQVLRNAEYHGFHHMQEH